MPEKENQKRKILAYIMKHGSITNVDAVMEIGCYRLAARIYDLIKDGYPIVCTMETGKNRDGEDVRYGRYSLAA